MRHSPFAYAVGSPWRGQTGPNVYATGEYIGHNYVGHNYVGHNHVGHNYAGHNYCVGLLVVVAATAAAGVDDTIGDIVSIICSSTFISFVPHYSWALLWQCAEN